MITLLRNLLKYGKVSKATDDSKAIPVTQVQYFSKTGDAYELYPYGLCAVAPKGSLAIILNVNGQEENRAAIATLLEKRFKDLKEGEVAIGNFLTGSFIKFLENGNIEVFGVADLVASISANVTVNAGGDVTVGAGGNISANAGGNASVSAGGNISATAGGNLTATATGNASVTAAAIALNGPVTVNGTLSVAGGGAATFAGNVIVTGTLSQGGKDVGAAHTHSGVTSGPSNTGAVV